VPVAEPELDGSNWLAVAVDGDPGSELAEPAAGWISVSERLNLISGANTACIGETPATPPALTCGTIVSV
jgi:hypothetical protein